MGTAFRYHLNCLLFISEYISHDSALRGTSMAKRKLLIVAGAGATIEFGMPSVAGVDSILIEHSLKWFPLADDLDKNLYSYLKEGLDKYFRSRAGLRI